MDPRVAALRDRLSRAFLARNHGEYFRSRVHGWAAYRSDSDVSLPVGIAERLTTTFIFDRHEDAEHISTLDSFILAYHAAESYWRYFLALLDGHGPKGAPAIAMAEVKAGAEFNDRVDKILDLTNAQLTEALDYVFLPSELAATWSEEEPTLASVQEYLRLWCRALGRFLIDWRKPYNSAKHGLAVESRPEEFTFLLGDSSAAPVGLFNGPTLCTLETEPVKDAEGKRRKGPDGKFLSNWFWAYRAIDPDELIAQTIITADLLDWLRSIARARLLGVSQIPLLVRSEPKPLEIRRPGPPGRLLRLPLTAEPLPSGPADELLRQLGLGDDD